MPAAPTVQDLVQRNQQFAETYKPLPYFSEFQSFGWLMPKVLVISCADMRVVPERYLGLGDSDAVIFRNVCGHTGQELSALLALDTVVNFEEIMVVHHTDCGANAFSEEGFRRKLRDRHPDLGPQVDGLPYGGSIQGQDLDQTVRDDMAILKRSPLMRKELVDRIFGFVFDVKTGLLSSVDS